MESATACHVHLVLHYVTLMVRVDHLSREQRNALWHHLTQQQLHPFATYKKKLAQYSLYGHYGRRDEETEEDLVRRSEEEKKRE